MAGTVKDAKGTNKAKKPKRRLKRSIRKTLGALFMATALVVAAIPVDNLRAEGENEGIETVVPAAERDALNASVRPKSDIPQITKDTKIYTSEDKLFQFAYIMDGTSPVAVILGYDKGYLEGKALEVPNEVNAYAQYITNLGSLGGYAAVGKNGNFLFYRVRQNVEYRYNNRGQLVNSSGEIITTGTAPDYREFVNYVYDKDEPTKAIGEIVSEETGDFLPCYLDDIKKWENIDRARLYYDDREKEGTNPSKTEYTEENKKYFIRASDPAYQRITGAMVAYIGNQWLQKDEKTGVWSYGGNVTSANPQQGVFAGASNIVKLEMGVNFKGVGDYAFWGSGITSLKLENGLNTIGEGAFKDCIKLQDVSLDLDCGLKALGAYAFQGCTELKGLSIPWSVQEIGDSAVEGCIKLQWIDLCSEGKNAQGTSSNLLRKIGRDVFKNCELLKSVTFPSGCEGPVYISSFLGCKKLAFVGARNSKMTFPEEAGVLDYNGFKRTVGDAFYFEGFENSALHELAKNNCFAFSYLTTDDEGNYVKQNLYEITLAAEEPAEGSGLNTFVVTPVDVTAESGPSRMCRYTGDNGVKTLSIPTGIGPYAVNILDSKVFENQCNLDTVIIPNTVNTIGDDTFKGCHSLTNVIFDGFEKNSNLAIGSNAFKAQDFTGATHKCQSKVETDPATKEPEKKLCFTGPISFGFGPYRYAMTEGNTYSAGGQKDSYITYYSGWPQNLEIRYNDDKSSPNYGLSELVNFPAVSELNRNIYQTDKYKYLAVHWTDEEKQNGKTAYEEAMESAYAKYQSSNYSLSALTPNERALVNAALNLEVPDGVQAIKDGLIKEKEATDDKTGHPHQKTVKAYGLLKVNSGEEVTGSDGKTTSIKEGTGTFAGCKHLTSIDLRVDSNGNGVTQIGTPVEVKNEDGSTKTELGRHAFFGCEELTKVSLPPTLAEIGINPFYGCKVLNSVDFQGNPNFTFENDMIFGPAEDGTSKGKLIECLEKKTGFVLKAMLAGVKELGEEAFRDTGVVNVDLTDTEIETIYTNSFSGTKSMYEVTLPASLKEIEDFAFYHSTVDRFIVRSSYPLLKTYNDTFTGLTDSQENPKIYGNIIWQSGPGTRAEEIGKAWKFNTGPVDVETFYKVNFRYWDDEQQKEVMVDAENEISDFTAVEYPAEIGSIVTKDGVKQRLASWDLGVDETAHKCFFSAVYERLTWTVTFIANGITTMVEVPDGGNALRQPDTPQIEGANWIGQKANGDEGDLTYVTENLTAMLDDGTRYSLDVTGGTVPGGSSSGMYTQGTKIRITADEPAEGQEFKGWSTVPENIDKSIVDKTIIITMPEESVIVIANFGPQGSTNPPDGPTPTPTRRPDDPDDPDNPNRPTPSPVPTATPRPANLFTLTVQHGNASGQTTLDVQAGSPVVIIADPPEDGRRFKEWVVSPASAVIVDKTSQETILTMPNSNAVVMATYTGGNNGGNGSGGEEDDRPSHVLTVRGGSGSGTYKTGDQVIIVADTPAEGKEFVDWSVLPAATVMSDKTNAVTIITMPDDNTAIVANFKDKEDTSTTSPSPTPAVSHTLQVYNGNNSGSYLPDQQVIVTANDPPAGQVFAGWTVSPVNTVMTDPAQRTVVLTMPANDVALVANFKPISTGSGNTTGSSNTSGSSNSSNNNNNNNNSNNSNNNNSNNNNNNRPGGGTTTPRPGGTSLVIDKNGISNTGVASATVNGSSDDFVVRITEDASAAEAVIRALTAEYGSLDNIKYVPMDISLYDSTGNRKITDTTGLSVTITLPIPDSLIEYAGNNKAAGVVNDRLDKRAVRFTTINGVSCITFTAEHFSPYVIYVDTSNLSASGTVSDNTPKTGDGIHPKWFLSIGLACLSFVMFMQKDNKKSMKKQKAAVRAR